MKILLDTNFILTCVKQKIDIASAEEILNEKIEWIIPQEVLNELGNLKDRTGMKITDKNAAKLSFEILQLLNPKIIGLKSHNPNVDMKILNYILGTDIILATLDRGLKDKVTNKILTIRGNKKLEII
jgi:rRNA-processing protein FCF1